MFYVCEVQNGPTKLFLLVFVHETSSACGTYKHITDKIPALRSLQFKSKR